MYKCFSIWWDWGEIKKAVNVGREQKSIQRAAYKVEVVVKSQAFYLRRKCVLAQLYPYAKHHQPVSSAKDFSNDQDAFPHLPKWWDLYNTFIYPFLSPFTQVFLMLFSADNARL